MSDTLDIAAGTTKVFPRQRLDVQGNAYVAVTNPSPYLGSDTLACQIWAGDDTASLAAPSVAWTDATTGSFAITLAAANTTGLSGTYRGRVTVTRGGLTGILDDFRLRVTMAPGTAAAPLAFTVMDDLTDYFPTLEDLQSDASQVGFREEQARATTRLIDALVSLYKPANVPLMGEPGFNSWSLFGGVPNPSRWLREQLVPLTPGVAPPAAYPLRSVDSSGFAPANLIQPRVSTALLLYDEVLEIVAKWALSRIMKAQIGRGSDQDWWSLSRMFSRDANSLFASRRFEIDLSIPQAGWSGITINGGGGSLR